MAPHLSDSRHTWEVAALLGTFLSGTSDVPFGRARPYRQVRTFPTRETVKEGCNLSLHFLTKLPAGSQLRAVSSLQSCGGAWSHLLFEDTELADSNCRRLTRAAKAAKTFLHRGHIGGQYKLGETPIGKNERKSIKIPFQTWYQQNLVRVWRHEPLMLKVAVELVWKFLRRLSMEAER